MNFGFSKPSERHTFPHTLNYSRGYPSVKPVETSKESLELINRNKIDLDERLVYYTYGPPRPRDTFPETLSVRRGCTSVDPLNDPKEALDLLEAQNKILDKTMVELTYGPPRPHVDPFIPSFVLLDNKVLKFMGVTYEAIQDWPREEKRVHLVNVMYYLENDTIKVMEPKVENSGFQQGTMATRTKYQNPRRPKNYHWKDLNIGTTININYRDIYLYDCDPWTREYLTFNGIEVRDSEPKPENPIVKERELIENRGERKSTPQDDLHPSGRFYKYDGKELRFYGIIKDGVSEDMRRVILKFFLGDGALEVVENTPPNSGRIRPVAHSREAQTTLPIALAPPGPWVIIIKRQKVLLDRKKEVDKIPCYLQPRNEDDITWITPDYFRTGQDLKILGKTFFFNKCDDFTKEFYKTEFDVDQQEWEVVGPSDLKAPMVVPPHTLGSWDETMENCFRPHRQVKTKEKVKKSTQFGEFKLEEDEEAEEIRRLQEEEEERREYKGRVDFSVEKVKRRPLKPKDIAETILRFSAFMDTPRESEQDRTFVIYYFMEDDTVKIYENRIDGHPGGTFLARGQLRKDLGPTPSTTPSLVLGAKPVYYDAPDFYIGARIKVNGSRLVIKDADLKVFAFMEKHPEIFPDISVEEQKKLSESLKGFNKPSHEERMSLLHKMKMDVIRNCRSTVFPWPHTLDLGDGYQVKSLVKEKIFSANLPINQVYLDQLLDYYSFQGKTDINEVKALLLVAMGHKSMQCGK